MILKLFYYAAVPVLATLFIYRFNKRIKRRCEVCGNIWVKRIPFNYRISEFEYDCTIMKVCRNPLCSAYKLYREEVTFRRRYNVFELAYRRHIKGEKFV